MTVEVHKVYQKLDKGLLSAAEQTVDVHKDYKKLDLALPTMAKLTIEMHKVKEKLDQAHEGLPSVAEPTAAKSLNALSNAHTG